MRKAAEESAATEWLMRTRSFFVETCLAPEELSVEFEEAEDATFEEALICHAQAVEDAQLRRALQQSCRLARIGIRTRNDHKKRAVV